MIAENIARISGEIGPDVRLIVVSKFRTTEEIMEAYNCGQRAFAENKVQSLTERHTVLPSDIEWHMIGHLQSNKVKNIAPFVSMVHSVDSMKLLNALGTHAIRCGRTIDCLLQIHIAKEETKYGLSKEACRLMLKDLQVQPVTNIRIRGLMGMASNTQDEDTIKSEFSGLSDFYNELKAEYGFDTLSMGMSGDYKLALACGSNMLRIGSLIFA